MAKVTIQDVAREAGVALGTVSNVLNHPEKVKPATMQLVRDAMDRLGYAPNQSARLLAGGRQRIFGLVLPRLGHGFSLQISSGAEAEALRHGYDLLIANADDDDARSDRYARLFAGMQVAGILVQPLAERDWRPPAAPVTGDANIPIVYLGIQSNEPGWFAAADNGAQGRLIPATWRCSARPRPSAGRSEPPESERWQRTIPQSALSSWTKAPGTARTTGTRSAAALPSVRWTSAPTS